MSPGFSLAPAAPLPPQQAQPPYPDVSELVRQATAAVHAELQEELDGLRAQVKAAAAAAAAAAEAAAAAAPKPMDWAEQERRWERGTGGPVARSSFTSATFSFTNSAILYIYICYLK